jgi:glyoxylase-like metal-dependent hydrolase (beta-lactamase superfamily II)
MKRKVLIGVAGLLGACVAFLALGLAWAHLAIRRERPALPTGEEIVTQLAGDDRPVRLTYINTASQRIPRAAVLDPARDPQPAGAVVMSYPSFVLEWADGRILLIDTGMTRHAATAFGKPIEWLTGGDPIRPLGSVARQLGEARQRVRAVIFTHLHTDHTGGLVRLCTGMRQRVRVFLTDAQAERPNYTTRPGLRQIGAARCVRIEPLSGGPLMPLRGIGREALPGVFVIDAGGHTPGSQIIVAHVVAPEGPHTYVFVGDIVNNIDGITYDIPKPTLYRWLIVPEDETRQGELRRYLRELRDRYGFALLVSHDQREIEQSGIAAWSNEQPAATPNDQAGG